MGESLLYLNPETFKTAPLFLLSIDLPQNDHVLQTITHRLHDANVATKVAQFILLGIGGAMDELGFNPELYHLNEAHGVSSVFYLCKKFGNKVEEVKKRLVFTTTYTRRGPVMKSMILTCRHKMSYFCGLSIDEVRKLTGLQDDLFNHSLVALRFAHLANGVSKLHGEVSRSMWGKYENICPIISITNAQNWRYWADKQLYRAAEEGNDSWWDDRKKIPQTQVVRYCSRSNR